MEEQAEFERAYCFAHAALALLDSLDLDIAAAHMTQAIEAMERSDAAIGMDLALLRTRSYQDRSTLN